MCVIIHCHCNERQTFEKYENRLIGFTYRRNCCCFCDLFFYFIKVSAQVCACIDLTILFVFLFCFVTTACSV